MTAGAAEGTKGDKGAHGCSISHCTEKNAGEERWTGRNETPTLVLALDCVLEILS